MLDAHGYPIETKRRSLDAGAGGRRWENAHTLPNLNRAVEAAGATIRQRAAYYARNNAWIARGTAAMVANAVGTGIMPTSRHPSPEVRKRLQEMFSEWTDVADVTGLTDYYGLQALAMRSLVEAGEGFARFRPAAGQFGFALQMIAADQVDGTLHRELSGGRRIRAGVELDEEGRRLAYYVLTSRPGEIVPAVWTPARIAASDMLHVLEVLEPGQVRGLSWLASVLLRAHEIDVYEDAQIVRQKVAALFAGFILDPTGDGAGFEGNRSGDILETGLEPGTLKTLPPGFDIKFSTPAEIGDNGDFLKTQLRAIAAGLGVTYEQLTGDLSGVNYSSIRAGLVEFRRRVDALRWHVLVPQFCRPVWERFVRLQVIRGEIPAADFERNPAQWLSADWHPPGWDWVDPVKDIQAEKAAVDAGFKARSQVITERGEDPERVDALRAADAERARRLGFSGAEAAPQEGAPDSGTGAPSPNSDEQGSGEEVEEDAGA